MNFSEWPLKQWVQAAFSKRNIRPTGKYRSPLWEFCWFLKGHPELASLAAIAALRRVEQVMGQLGDGYTWRSFGISDSDARIEFFSLWDTIKFPYGSTTIEQAIEHAKIAPLQIPDSPATEFIIAVSTAFYLAESTGNNTVFLPCEILAKHLSCSTMTVSRIRRLAVGCGYFDVATPHSFRSGRKGTATEYRVNVAKLAEFVPAD